MNKITLTEAQKAQIMAALAEYHNEKGAFDFDIDIDDNIVVNAKGRVDFEGYIEDDFTCGYGNGTGGWIETYRSASVILTAYDGDGEVEIDREIEKEAQEYLNAA